MRLERDVARLMGVAIAIHERRERGVDDMLDVRRTAKTLAQLDTRGAAIDQHLAHTPIDVDVSAPESVDRLLRIPDDEELARDGCDPLPPRLVRIVGGKKQQQL